MSISVEVAKELLGMFLADARLTTATLVLVAIVAGLVVALRVEPGWMCAPSWLSRDPRRGSRSRSKTSEYLMKAIVWSGSRAGRAARTIGGGLFVLVLSV